MKTLLLDVGLWDLTLDAFGNIALAAGAVRTGAGRGQCVPYGAR